MSLLSPPTGDCFDISCCEPRDDVLVCTQAWSPKLHLWPAYFGILEDAGGCLRVGSGDPAPSGDTGNDESCAPRPPMVVVSMRVIVDTPRFGSNDARLIGPCDTLITGSTSLQPPSGAICRHYTVISILPSFETRQASSPTT